MMSLRLQKLTFLLLLACLVPFRAEAAARQKTTPSPKNTYQQAFAALESGQCGPAEKMLKSGNDRVLNKVLRGLLMAQPGNGYSFDELASFITGNPDWHGLNGIRMIAEQKIPSSASPRQIVNWFNAYPPLTGPGFIRYIEALEELGETGKAYALVRDRWVNKDLPGDEFTAYLSRFGRLLSAKDHRGRLDRLLWDNNTQAARAMYPYVSEGHKALAEARLALVGQQANAEAIAGRVPASLQRDPGLLFELLRWRRKNGMDEEAVDILKNAPADLVRPESWWGERHIIVRRLMERQDFSLAYKLAANHGLSSGFELMQAEFLAGWLALRFLKRPDLAESHFRALLDNASTPISRARGSYWLGRALEELGDTNQAQQAYETAAALNTTFYGQLAIARLYPDPVIRSEPEPPIPAPVRNKFFARDAVKAVERLYRIGQKDLARRFFRAITDYSSQRFEFALLMELAYELQRPDWAINSAKAAAQKNMLIGAGSFPVLSIHVPSPPDPAFTHAMMRQESMFNADSVSPAGARGLMQLMPETAKDICRKINAGYSESRLSEPSYNLRLGTAFMNDLLNRFEGSYVLALAAYNAGPRRAREWMEQFGDPRSPGVDPVDWIETIPVYETRNYIQRIIENFQFYRARLNGGKAPLQIMRDLKR